MSNAAVEQFWQDFLKAEGLDPSTKYYACEYFGNEEIADELLALIVEGKKTATCGCVLSYEAEGVRLPRAGDISIVTTFDGRPGCVIRSTAVTVLPFNEVTWEMAKLEGEDTVMQTWVDGHRRFFEMDGKELDFTFTEDTLVAFEEFEVIYRPAKNSA